MRKAIAQLERLELIPKEKQVLVEIKIALNNFHDNLESFLIPAPVVQETPERDSATELWTERPQIKAKPIFKSVRRFGKMFNHLRMFYPCDSNARDQGHILQSRIHALLVEL